MFILLLLSGIAPVKWRGVFLLHDAYMKPGGYSLKKEYEIAPPPEVQYIELHVYREGNGLDRKNYKVMNYHAIQI